MWCSYNLSSLTVADVVLQYYMCIIEEVYMMTSVLSCRLCSRLQSSLKTELGNQKILHVLQNDNSHDTMFIITYFLKYVYNKNVRLIL